MDQFSSSSAIINKTNLQMYQLKTLCYICEATTP